MTNSGDSKNRKRLRILDRLFETYAGAPFAIRTWDEWSWRSSENQSPVFTVIFRTRHALEQLFVDPSEWTLGEAFVEGGIDVEGDLVSAFDLLEPVLEQPLGWWYGLLQNLSAISYRILRLGHGRKHSRSGDRAAISYHYDQPPEFFLPWLGPSLAYSCAYFLHAEDSLDVAQKNKLDYICRKLRLQPGDRFLDIGCGWPGRGRACSLSCSAGRHVRKRGKRSSAKNTSVHKDIRASTFEREVRGRTAVSVYVAVVSCVPGTTIRNENLAVGLEFDTALSCVGRYRDCSCGRRDWNAQCSGQGARSHRFQYLSYSAWV